MTIKTFSTPVLPELIFIGSSHLTLTFGDVGHTPNKRCVITSLGSGPVGGRGRSVSDSGGTASLDRIFWAAAMEGWFWFVGPLVVTLL